MAQETAAEELPQTSTLDLQNFLVNASRLHNALDDIDLARQHGETMGKLAEIHAETLKTNARAALEHQGEVLGELLPTLLQSASPAAFTEYLTDAAQRSVLFLDTLRRRGNNFVSHEENGSPPILAYDFEVLIDGSTLPRPVNYSLVRILPPKGTTVRDNGRPYVIIDPRAGHGSGIGGFKSESEVGAALKDGHPVYFVIFRPHPEKGQTLADVTRAEAGFVREVQRRHPHSPKPIVIGNCQGGWASMLLAATNPDLAGPLVVIGAPVSYWSGVKGKNPMRYLGGLTGGVLPALLLADLGNGEFDGANLVQNFESLNPANSLWKKYYDVFAHDQKEADRYLEFERWWSGFYFMNESEIRWIVENLFIGNKLARGIANLDSRTHVDLRNIRSPIIVFASHGDNITPPVQALNWIPDVYKSTQEIKARGQRIVYTIHDSVGHLGIFVGSTVVRKQHTEIVSTLKTIEALAPGLYEMVILDEEGEGHDKRFSVAFEERSIEDILKLDDNRNDEAAFAAVSRVSELGAEIYDLTLRPLIKAAVTPASAALRTQNHPLRQRRYALSDKNPLLAPVAPLAEQVRSHRAPAAPDNPFLQLERFFSGVINDNLNLYRDVRDSLMERCFFSIYDSPLVRRLGEGRNERVADAPQEDLRAAREVQFALDHIDQGGYAEAVIRMLILLAHSRHAVRRDRLEKSDEVLHQREPFASLGASSRNRIIHQQSIIVEFELERALATLPLLLPDPADHERALEVCAYVAGPDGEMSSETSDMFKQLRQVLDAPVGGETAKLEHKGKPSSRARGKADVKLVAPPSDLEEQNSEAETAEQSGIA